MKKIILLTPFNEKSLVMCLKTVTFEVGTTGKGQWTAAVLFSNCPSTKKRATLPSNTFPKFNLKSNYESHIPISLLDKGNSGITPR